MRITRRHALSLLPAAAALPAIAPPAVARADQPAAAVPAAVPPPLAVVMNSGEASLSVVDMNTLQVVRTLPTLREPSHWALTPDNTELLIADASGNALFAINPVTAEPIGHRVIADPYQIGFSPDNRLFFVNSLRLDHVDVYEPGTYKLVKRLSVGSMPSHLGFSPDSKWSFHSMQGSNTLVSLDIATLTPRWKIKVGSTPAGVLWHNGRVLCCVIGENYMVEVDPATGAITRKVKTGVGPHNVFVTPDRQTMYVTNRIGGSMVALDPVTFALRRTYPFPDMGPDDIGMSPDGRVWVALRFAETVGVLDPVSGAVERIRVGRSPHGLFLNTELQTNRPVTAELL